MTKKTFGDGFRYGLGLWLARLIVTIIGVVAGACLFALTLDLLDVLMRWLGLY